MAERPSRTGTSTSVLLRLPPALLQRVNRCQALLQLQAGARVSRIDAVCRLLEVGCDAVERMVAVSQIALLSQVSVSEIATISQISEVSDDKATEGDSGEDEARAPADAGTEPSVSASEKALIMTRLRQLRSSGLSMAEIATQLHAEGVRTLSGKGEWQKGTVGKLLKMSR